MAFTRAQALTLNEIHDDGGCPSNPDRRGRDKGAIRWRRNGRTQTWVTRPNDFRMPIKHGLRDYSEVTPSWNNVHAPEDCPRTAAPINLPPPDQTDAEAEMLEMSGFCSTCGADAKIHEPGCIERGR